MEKLKGSWRDMSAESRLRNYFAGTALAGALLFGLASTGCNNSNYEDRQHEQDAAIQQLEQRNARSPRLRTIIEAQRKYETGASVLQFLVTNEIRLELSADNLPDGAVIRLFKDRWQINPFVPSYTQSWAVYKATDYAEAQAREGLPWGVGESFSIPGGTLSPVGNIPLPARPSLRTQP